MDNTSGRLTANRFSGYLVRDFHRRRAGPAEPRKIHWAAAGDAAPARALLPRVSRWLG